jgi:mono/diheme cytochrome c family protein
MRTIRLIAGCLIAFHIVSARSAEPSTGQREYETKCLMCHGPAAKGDGWFAPFLKVPPPSLTQLKRNNGGVFPFDAVYLVIDGRKEVRVHGSRDMPVWGALYRAESGKEFPPFQGLQYADEGVVRARILALIDYLSQLQE